jgi:ribonuclease BN (tRNA processing enzyme)
VRLTVIGCSGSFPGPDSPASSYLVESQGFRLLVDLGSGALGPLQRYSSLDDIDAICLSHLHADHCLDLCGYWVARTFAPGGPPATRLPVYGPPGTDRRMAQAYGLNEHPGMTDTFDFFDLEVGKRELGPFQITLARMNHPVETFGFRIEADGKVLAYSADTGETPALVDLARNADLLLCEASFLSEPGLPPDLHLTAKQAAEHATRAGVENLTLTHLVPWNDRDRIVAEASAAFNGKLTLATSGLVSEL